MTSIDQYVNVKEKSFESKIKAMVKENQASRAIDLISQEIKSDPENWYYTHLLGWVYRSKNDLNKALEAYQQAEKLAPEEPYVQAALGELLLAGGKEEEALPYLEFCIAAWPESAEAYSFYGMALLRIGNFDQAEDILEKSCRLSAVNPDARYGLVNIYDQTSRDKLVRPLLESYLNDAPNLASAYGFMADYLFWEGGNCETSCTFYEKAVEEYYQSDNQSWFRQYISTTDYPDALLDNYLYALLRCEYFQLARDIIKRFVQLPASTFWRAELNRQKGDLEAALEIIRNGLEAYPDYPNLRAKYGELLLAVGQPDQALMETKKAIEINHSNGIVDNWYDGLLLVAFLLNGQEVKTNQHLDRAGPDERERILVHMIHYLSELKEWQKVIHFGQLFLADSEEDLPVIYSLAKAYAEGQQYSEAISNFEKLLEIQPGNGIAQLELGIVYAQMGRVKEGERALKKALKGNNLSINHRKLAQEKLDALQ